jgi:hypothetical protein
MKKELLTLLILFVSPSFVSGDVVLTTGFETTGTPAYPAAVANLPTTSTLPVYDQNNQAVREIRLDNSPFGTGQYLALGSNNLRVRSNGTTPLTTVVFDLYEPAGFNGNIRLGFGNLDLNNNTTTGAYTGWTLNNGVISVSDNTALASGSNPTLLEDTHYLAHFFLNRSGSSETVNFGSSSLTLGNNQAGLLFYNVANGTFTSGAVYNHTQSVTNPNTFFFRAFNADTGGLILVDNFTRYNELIAIPEPSTFALLATLAGGLCLTRRRKNFLS